MTIVCLRYGTQIRKSFSYKEYITRRNEVSDVNHRDEGKLLQILSIWNNIGKMGLQSIVRFHSLTAASMETTAFWDIAPCSLVK
jgi:hypothetical protein